MPYFTDSDRLRLADDFTFDGNSLVLVDTSLGAKHRVHKKASEILEALARSAYFSQLRTIAVKQRLSGAELAQILDFLNDCGALYRQRELAAWPEAWRIRSVHRLHGIVYAPLSWRRTATLVNLSLATLRASLPIPCVIIALNALVILSGLGGWKDITAISLAGYLTFVCGLLLHEWTHILIAAKYASNTPVVMQRGLRLGILHRVLPKYAEASSALGGPIAGILFCGAVGFAALLATWHLMALCAFVTALIHLGALLPWYGDGATLRKLFIAQGERREATTA